MDAVRSDGEDMVGWSDKGDMVGCCPGTLLWLYIRSFLLLALASRIYRSNVGTGFCAVDALSIGCRAPGTLVWGT
jgi:hypothetical protein